MTDEAVEILQEEQNDKRWKTKGGEQRQSENQPGRSPKERDFWEETLEQRETLTGPGDGNPQDRKLPGAAGQEPHAKACVWKVPE